MNPSFYLGELPMNRLCCPSGLIALVLPIMTTAHAEEKPLVLDVWPGKVPGEKGDIAAEKMTEPKADDKRPVRRLTNVTQPTITVYHPTKVKNTGAAVVIAPGGGYNILAWDLEGEEVAVAQLDRRHRHRPEIPRAAPARRSQGRRPRRRPARRPACHEPGPQQGVPVESRRQADRHARLLGGRPPDGRPVDELRETRIRTDR